MSGQEEYKIPGEQGSLVTRRRFLEIAASITAMCSVRSELWSTEERHGIPYKMFGATGERVSAIGLGGYHIGTPAEADSVRIALKQSSPTGNLGPVIGELVQSPVVPRGMSAVQVRARAHDADGIADLTMRASIAAGRLGSATGACRSSIFPPPGISRCRVPTARSGSCSTGRSTTI